MENDMRREAPLADRMRSRTFDEFFGQEKIVGPGTLLRRAIENDELFSIIFWGPPGSGKTTLARVIADKITLRTNVGRYIRHWRFTESY